MVNLGRKFRIKLTPARYTEHLASPLAENDGVKCSLVAHLFGNVYVTDVKLPEGTPDSDYARGGKLLVVTDKDGVLL